MKFTVKDLVNASLFSVLIVVFYWCAGMLGFIPVTMPAVPFICGFVAGHGVYVMPGTVLLAFAGEWILKMGGYKSINHARWAYTVFVLL